MLSDEQKDEIAEETRNKVNETIETAIDEKLKEKLKEVPGGFKPEGDEIKVEVINDPEDLILADKTGGFKSFGHFLKELVAVEDKTAVRAPEALTKWAEAERKTAGTMEEGVPSQGGYTVPTEFGAMIYQQSLESAIVRPRARFQPMASNRLEINADVDKDHSSNYFGGVYIYRSGEGGQLTASNPTYQRIALTLHKVTGLCHITSELLEDSAIALEADVSRKFAEAIAFTQDDDFLNGTGANQPLGALNTSNPAIITVSAVSGQGSSTVIAENIRDMWTRLHARNKPNAVWLVNQDVFPQLFGMILTAGTAAVPIWLPAGGVSGAPYSSLMGRPVIETEKCQTLGTAGDIALVDFSAYVVAGRTNSEAPNVATSIHLKFDYDMQSFRFTMRYDGQPTWTSTLTPKYSSNTLSPFVVLNSTRT